MKVSELEGVELDYWVAKAEGHDFDSIDDFLKDRPDYRPHGLHYSSDWSKGGPIIERENIAVYKDLIDEIWVSEYINGRHTYCTGPTPLIAAMRAYVDSKLGEEVKDWTIS